MQRQILRLRLGMTRDKVLVAEKPVYSLYIFHADGKHALQVMA